MARGHPDFFGMPVYPEYGMLKKVDYSGTVVSMAGVTAILNVTGKGLVRGGYVRILNITQPALVYLYCYVDDILVSYNAMSWYGYWNIKDVESPLLRCCYYDDKGYEYLYLLQRDFRYGTMCRIAINNTDAINAPVVGQLLYSEITG